MSSVKFLLENRQPRIVGSFGSLLDLQNLTAEAASQSCDLVEIRLDLLLATGATIEASRWKHLAEIPLLFTARRQQEGGALDLDTPTRLDLLRIALDDAAWIDLEVASLPEATDFLQELATRQIPWIASFHDFTKLPETAELEAAVRIAKEAGATLFKAAAHLASHADLARLAEFQVTDHGLPVATMGMGPLAPVSRLLCAQSGSLLNYGYLGQTATAPGQWDSAFLKQAISRLVPF